MRTVLVALTLADASRWPELAGAARRPGGVAAGAAPPARAGP